MHVLIGRQWLARHVVLFAVGMFFVTRIWSALKDLNFLVLVLVFVGLINELVKSTQ